MKMELDEAVLKAKKKRCINFVNMLSIDFYILYLQPFKIKTKNA